MRKSLKSISKRKWIVGGLLFFGGAALLTTGFATWVIGTQILSDRDNLNIVVDTAKNESISISAELSDNSIHLREKVSQDSSNPDQIIFTDNTENADFEIKFSKITIECGVEFYQRNYCTYDSQTGLYTPKTFDLSIKFDMSGTLLESLPASQANTLEDLTQNIVVKNQNIKFVNDHLQVDASGNAVTSYQYIDIDTDKITLSESDVANKWTDASGGFKQLIITDKVIKFKWGNFFSYRDHTDTVVNNGPAAYYNNLSKIKGSSWRTLSNLQKVEDEINAMNAVFTPTDSSKKSALALEISLPEVINA